MKKGKERLDDALETIKALCESVESPQDTIKYLHYFCGKDTSDKDEVKQNEQKRIAMYKYTSSLLRAYANIANEMEAAGYTPAEIKQIKKDVKHFENARLEIKLASGDYIDLKAYEPAMRHLIDTYISADESEKISAFDDLTLIQLIVERGVTDAISSLPKGIRKNESAVAETIENNMRKVIIDEQPTNPKYYENMSTLLDALIQARKTEALKYEEYLAKIVELSNQVQNPNTTAYPKLLNSNAKRALYDNLGKNEDLAIALNDKILSTRKAGWRGNPIKEREVRIAVRNVLKEFGNDAAEDVDRIFEIVKKQN